jgi:hypothetical protein
MLYIAGLVMVVLIASDLFEHPTSREARRRA